jgi:ATP-dependent helicase/nuclease subunit A
MKIYQAVIFPLLNPRAKTALTAITEEYAGRFIQLTAKKTSPGERAMSLNKEQEKAVFCTENAVVAAGAGSGKTRVLAERFVWLLTEKDYKVDQILTLTFTKKAAAQMFKRIYTLLQQKAQTETGEKAERARKALDDFIKARIQTHDSYSASLVKQCAPRYGISPDFQIDQERCKTIAEEISYPFLIEKRGHPAIKKLYSLNRPDGIAREIFASILFNYSDMDRPSTLRLDIKKQFEIICAEWNDKCSELKKLLEETENLILEDNTLLPDLVPLMEKYKKTNVVFPDSEEIRKYFDALTATEPETCIERAESAPLQKTLTALLYFLNELCKVSLQKGKRSNNPVKENIKLIRVLFEHFFSLSVSCMQAGFHISLAALMEELQIKYIQKKRSESVLTFRDVANLSRTILIEQRDIRQNEKESFKAVMIDEFQDNNELQKDILFLLAEKHEVTNDGVPSAKDITEGKLFFVGDEKQSIYLFRDADVSVFRKLKDEIKSENLPLTTNYRSSPVLIQAFNSIFPSVFAPQENLPLYEASYTPLTAGSKEDGKLSFCLLTKKAEAENEDDTKLSTDENEARFAAEQIRKLLDEKKYQAKDIAILLRTRNPQEQYEKHLRRLDIPYVCESINDLFDGGLVNDIMSVLRLAAHPNDSASYAEMLRSPFAGLSLCGTAVCLSFYSAQENPVPFDEKPLEHLDKTDKEKYLNGKNIFNLILEKAKTENISSLVSELWYAQGYRYETEWNSETSVYREIFDYLYNHAVKADMENQGLGSFTDFMRSLRDSDTKLSEETELPLERPDAVHLMTIHKSKGLEFPVVFLCGCGKKSQSDRANVVYRSDEAGVVFSAPIPESLQKISGKRSNYFWQRAGKETKQKRLAELRRLLYVGMTRAEKELYITGAFDMEKEGIEIVDDDTFFGLLVPAIKTIIPKEIISEIPVYTEEYLKKQGAKNAKYENNQKNLGEYIKKKELLYTNCKTITTPVVKDNHKSPVSLKRDEDGGQENALPGKNFFISREFSGENSGDIFKNVDSMLDKFSKAGEESEKFNSGSFGTIAHICVEAHLNTEEPVIPGNIAGFLNINEFNAFLDAGKQLASRFVQSPLGRIAEKAERRESEFSFRSFLKNTAGEEIFINGTIDLFFEDDNSFHVVDFKTDNHEMPGLHIAQMTCYYQAVSSLFALPAKKECRVWLYYLRTGHAVEVTERVKKFDLQQRAFG